MDSTGVQRRAPQDAAICCECLADDLACCTESDARAVCAFWLNDAALRYCIALVMRAGGTKCCFAFAAHMRPPSKGLLTARAGSGRAVIPLTRSMLWFVSVPGPCCDDHDGALEWLIFFLNFLTPRPDSANDRATPIWRASSVVCGESPRGAGLWARAQPAPHNLPSLSPKPSRAAVLQPGQTLVTLPLLADLTTTVLTVVPANGCAGGSLFAFFVRLGLAGWITLAILSFSSQATHRGRTSAGAAAAAAAAA